MDFRLTDDQETLVDGVRDFLAGTHAPGMLRELDASESGRSEAFWHELTSMGIPGLLIPEEHGGLGLGLVEGSMIAVELGRAGVAEPIADTALVAVPWLIARGLTERLAQIAAGEIKVALSHVINPWIADLDQADYVIADGHLIENDKPALPIESVDPLRRLYPAPFSGSDDALLDIAALITAAQLVGLADAMLSMATRYAKDRHQFGQPIGAFQAVKHHLASAAVAVEFAKPVLQRAAVALETGENSASLAVSHAKIAAGDAATAVAETAIQVHGAMGYTYEVDLHFWMKRTWALCGAWGSRGFHYARIENAVLGAHALGPSHTFA